MNSHHLRFGTGMLAALLLQSCDTPTEFSDTQIEAFVAQAGLPNATRPYYFIHLGDYDLQSFSVGHGQVVDCPALLRTKGNTKAETCRTGVAIGLRLGERVGWLQLEEDGLILPEDANRLDVVGPDDPVLGGALWDDLEGRDASFYHTYFKGRIVRDPDTPLPVLHRVADELTGWIWPPAGKLLLDNSVALADRTLVQKLAALPVQQGDPYAEVRAQAQALLAGGGTLDRAR